MIKKTIRRMGRAKFVVRYRQAAEPPEAAAPLGAMDSSAASSWLGRRIKLEDLADFKASVSQESRPVDSLQSTGYGYID